jgi:hypothetical protein
MYIDLIIVENNNVDINQPNLHNHTRYHTGFHVIPVHRGKGQVRSV